MRAQNHPLIHNPTLPTLQNFEDPIDQTNLYYLNGASQERIVYPFTQRNKDKTKNQIRNKYLDPENNKKMAFFEQLQKHQQYQAKIDKTVQYISSSKKEPIQQSVSSNKGLYKNTSFKGSERNRNLSQRTDLTPQSVKEQCIIEEIVQNQDLISKQKGLLEKVQDLKKLKLLKQYKFNHYYLPGVGKSPYIFNDTHSKCTNPGYSRNIEGGKFFTR
ncbi:unnamed protein product (macronuclear) [Paramecium tetraurelia]|uniref:Chromosome undetermined scaffold_1, whole genome shotgun sequence n=1 Tax=Paramecium tetraurelia TaxID=5888 RepID=Q6BGF0_PARTE|nr:hypothetical protein [Paramecium tetraurelia strain d4-2]XP_001423435.1 uncharacterized protein GSPATT00000472001 [Paramecium tetraurelia]CAH03270.1 hypothetical protein PTMB.73 [Paramecium tetraurelia]CAK56037.1 unnamed protein product [Paramecium tetraurelia]|eukprot:XP_001423435.1 hypothetical protein (macronuclear) [Paramecium tetraurelia strain d4-2]